MKVFEPKVEVRLIKAIRRLDVAPGIGAASSRYLEQRDLDLTPYLAEFGGVRLTKSVREPAGAFSITLADRAHPELLETLYALIEPMDLVEIRMAHDPSAYREQAGYRLPVVMRGLVSTVVRNEAMSGDRPVRHVTVSGQDFGKVLQIIQIYYLNNSVVGDNILSELAFFQKYAASSDAKIKPARDFVMGIIENVINPYLARLTAFSDGSKVGAQVINKMMPAVSIEGVASPYAVSDFRGGSLHQFLSSLLDVGPFNELYVEDRPDDVALVVRPVPFKDASGAFIQAYAAAESVDISDADLVAINVSRTDAGVANYYWVASERWIMMLNETARRSAQTGTQDNFILNDYPNCDAAFYGFRKMETSTILGPEDYVYTDASTKEQQPANTNAMSRWIDGRRAVLAKMNRDNVIYEQGTLRLRGNEAIRAGMYLRILRGAADEVISECYVSSVVHDFLPFGAFTTTVTFERGTGFIARAQKPAADYRFELDGLGVR